MASVAPAPDDGGSPPPPDMDLVRDKSRVACCNACGMTAFAGYSSCCARCSGPDGPHSYQCKKKNRRLSLHQRLECFSQLDRQKQEERMQQAVLSAYDSTSGPEIIGSLDSLVDDDWLGGVEPLDGNLYLAMALGALPRPTCNYRDLRGDSMTVSGFSLNAQYMGCILIGIIQIVGPVVITFTMMPSTFKISLDEWFASWTLFFNRLLGLLLIIVFNLHALYEVGTEAVSFEKVYSVFAYLGIGKKENTSMVALNAGCMTNCWVFMWSPAVTFVLMASAEHTKDVLFDALGICFLYALDDLGTPMVSFLPATAWPGQQLAWMFDRISDQPPPPTNFFKICYPIARWIIFACNFLLPVLFTVMDFGRAPPAAAAAINSTATK